MSSSLVQGVLPTVIDKETEVKREVSWMPHAPVGTQKGGGGNSQINFQSYRRNNVFSFVTSECGMPCKIFSGIGHGSMKDAQNC
jgi:hypothetical protein